MLLTRQQFPVFFLMMMVANVAISDVMGIVTSPDCTQQVTCLDLNCTAIQGNWYLKTMSTAGLFYTPTLNGYLMTFEPTEAQTHFDMTMKRSYGNATNTNLNCVQVDWRCEWNATAASCNNPSTRVSVTIVAVVYDSVLAMWSQHPGRNFTDDTHYIFSLFVRDPTITLLTSTLSPIASALTNYCGQKSADPANAFYDATFSYDPIPSFDSCHVNGPVRTA